MCRYAHAVARPRPQCLPGPAIERARVRPGRPECEPDNARPCQEGEPSRAAEEVPRRRRRLVALQSWTRAALRLGDNPRSRGGPSHRGSCGRQVPCVGGRRMRRVSATGLLTLVSCEGGPQGCRHGDHLTMRSRAYHRTSEGGVLRRDNRRPNTEGGARTTARGGRLPPLSLGIGGATFVSGRCAEGRARHREKGSHGSSR